MLRSGTLATARRGKKRTPPGDPAQGRGQGRNRLRSLAAQSSQCQHSGHGRQGGRTSRWADIVRLKSVSVRPVAFTGRVCRELRTAEIRNRGEVSACMHTVRGLKRLFAVAIATVIAASGPVRSDQIENCLPAPVRHAAAKEQAVTIETPDGRIRGTLAGPDAARPRALVLMLHGYTGTRNEIPVAGGEGMFARTARAFAERGIATLRIDFIGSGESDGSWADTVFSAQARDAIQGAMALREQYPDVDAPIGVLGYSQGGLVALRAAAGIALYDRLALWNPVMDPMSTYGKIFGRQTIFEGALRHEQGRDRSIVAGTGLRPGFFAEILTADPIADAAQVAAPVLIVTGQRDPLVVEGAALAQRIQDRRTAATAILDLDAGHDLGALANPSLLDAVIACTAGFVLVARPQ